ncbi:hypothetical protein JXQ70_10500 [bacterium]|nr:hypothetical protein [bacterium]
MILMHTNLLKWMNQTIQTCLRQSVVRCALILLVLIGIGSTVFADKAKKDKEIYNYYQLFADVYDKIVHYYVDETQPEVLIQGAIKGMLQILDRNNYFLTAEEQADGLIERVYNNEYGLILGVKNDKLLVISALPHFPAFQAGISSGDWIWSIGENVIGTLPSLMDNYSLLFGIDQGITQMETGLTSPQIQSPEQAENKGQSVSEEQASSKTGEVTQPGLTVTILRGENYEVYKRETLTPISTTVHRENEIETFGPDHAIGYIHPTGVETLLQFEQCIQQFSPAGSDQRPSSMVLDLRQIYALSDQVAIEIACLFMRSHQVITSLHYHDTKNPRPSLCTIDGPYARNPVVVLVDSGTAGGAEILAAALSSQSLCQSFGQSTFGYAFKREQIPTSDGGSIFVVAGVYHSPEGRKLYPDAFSPENSVKEALSPSEWQKMTPSERFAQDPVLVQAVQALQGTLSTTRND